MTLKEAFIRDHRIMTRGFWRLRQALDKGDWPEARSVAEQIDHEVGPHIEFEEQVYYPLLKPIIGAHTVEQFYQEHRTGRRLIEDILIAGTEPPDEATRAGLSDRCGKMLAHAQSCGTLISHLGALPVEEQESLQFRLEEIRERGQPWRELAERTPIRDKHKVVDQEPPNCR
jgi:hypothetical protein